MVQFRQFQCQLCQIEISKSLYPPIASPGYSARHLVTCRSRVRDINIVTVISALGWIDYSIVGKVTANCTAIWLDTLLSCHNINVIIRSDGRVRRFTWMLFWLFHYENEWELSWCLIFYYNGWEPTLKLSLYKRINSKLTPRNHLCKYNYNSIKLICIHWSQHEKYLV